MSAVCWHTYLFIFVYILVVEEEKDDGVMRIYFDPPHYTVMESVGSFMTTIVRKGGDLSLPVCVDYKTEDGTACSPDDYTGVSGTLTFGPGVTEQQVGLLQKYLILRRFCDSPPGFFRWLFLILEASGFGGSASKFTNLSNAIKFAPKIHTYIIFKKHT